jgi:hypothetical protein
MNGENTNHARTPPSQNVNNKRETSPKRQRVYSLKEDTRYSHAMSFYGMAEFNVSKITLEIPHFF